MSIAEGLAQVRARIERAAQAAGRSPGAVKLIAVSKTKPADAIREAYALGQRAFGENYAQELAAKAEALADLPDLEWHFVGHLQTNKARVAARFAHVVHTVDSAALVRELGKRAAKDRASPLDVLIEVNVGREPQKAGASASEIEEVMSAVRAAAVARAARLDDDAARRAMWRPPGRRSRRSPCCATSTAAPPRCPSFRWE